MIFPAPIKLHLNEFSQALCTGLSLLCSCHVELRKGRSQKNMKVVGEGGRQRKVRKMKKKKKIPASANVTNDKQEKREEFSIVLNL